MLRRNFGRLAAIGLTLSLALLGGAGAARADITLFLSQDGASFFQVATSTGPAAAFVGSFGDFSVNVDTASTNFTGTAASGTLNTTTNTTLSTTAIGSHTLRVLAAATAPGTAGLTLGSFTLPAGVLLALESNVGPGGSELLRPGGAAVSFVSTVNATGNVVTGATPAVGISTTPATVDANGAVGSPIVLFPRITNDGYTLFNHTTITLTLAGSTVTTAGSSTVTAVPEASSVVMSGIMALMGLGYGWRTRTRAAA
jgi:hypothetical protein